MKFKILGAAVLVLGMIVAACGQGTPSRSNANQSNAESATKLSQPALRADMRKLWEDHVTWTRMYIVDAAAGSPAAEQSAMRLLQNQVDIGTAIKPFYGDAAGDKLTALLKDHILIAVDLLAAARSGDKAKFDSANQRWYDNGDQIAAFLNGANPANWPLGDLKAMMRKHLDTTLAEASARLKGDWVGDVVAYDQVHQHILMMADALSLGIVKQFPNRFEADRQAPKETALAVDMRKLWEDHVTWTRMYIVDAAAGSPAAEQSAMRLLQNQVDIGTAIKPFYGDAAGDKLTALLKDHILIAVDLLAAARSGDKAKFDSANQRWYDNGDQIAAFLNGANPANWPLGDLKAMMRKHLDTTLAEASARLKGDWVGDVVAYDQVHQHILMMADALSQGIVKQFPDRLR